MHHKLLTLFFCVILSSVAVYGSQIRLMNARFFTGQAVSVTTDLFTTNNMSMAVQSRYPTVIGINHIPVSEYVDLPNYLFDLYLNLTMFVYNADDYFIPLAPLAQTNKFLVDNQRYTLVYVAKSEEVVDPPTDVPSGLFLVEELGPSPAPLLKIVNIAVASYPYGSMLVRADRFGEYDIPYGRDSGFFEVGVGFVNITAYFPGFTKSIFWEMSDLPTVLYIRGDNDGTSNFSYEFSESSWYEYNPPVAAPIFSEPVSAPVYHAPVSTPVSSPTAPSWIKVRFLNSAEPYLVNYTLFINGNETVISTNLMSEYKYIYGPTGQYEAVVVDQNGNLYTYTSLFLEAGRSYTIVNEIPYAVQIADDLPSWFTNRTSSYARIANFAFEASVVFDLDYWGTVNWYMYRGDAYNFVESFGGYGRVTASAGYQNITTNFFMPSATATSVFILRQGDTMFFYIDTQTLPGSTQVCVNGYLESNGICNCYSGYTSDSSSPYKCTVAAPYYCFNSQNDSLSNDFVPWIPYWNTQVYGNQLHFYVQSQIVTGRRTVIEMPNPQCNFLNNPQYYNKYDGGCTDSIFVSVPFTQCGFTKTSTISEDVYRGTVLVKQIDQVMVAGTAYDRVIETPMPISIRMPKTLAVQSYLQVYGPPSLAIEAAFVGQTVSTESQSGNLQYVSAVQYPLAIDEVQLVDLPYGVFAWVEVVNVNCSTVGPCVQRLEIHINTTSCSISGVYRMVVSLGCRSEQGCPEEAKNGTQVYLESRIVSQSLCGEMNVDIELYGYLQAYTDESMSNAALAFYPGQSAYFLISAFSPRVSLSKLSLVTLYYYGPNVNYEYLYYNSSATDIAAVNNFTTGSLGGSQAYFGLDITVSTPGSADYSLFKLYQGQNGVYNFVAVVDVEWYVENSPLPSVVPVTPVAAPVATPVASPVAAPFFFKKRMTLQGSVANLGSQFAAQVQIAGPTPSSPQQQQTPITVQTPTNKDPVSRGISLAGSAFGLIALAIVALF